MGAGLEYGAVNLCAIEGVGVLGAVAREYADTADDHAHAFEANWWQGDAMYRVTDNWNPPPSMSIAMWRHPSGATATVITLEETPDAEG